MRSLLLDPHGDDAALFAAYTVLREKPLVWIIRPTVPKQEIDDAMRAFDFDQMWQFSNPGKTWDRVYAPAWHEDGHAEHNEVSEMAADFGPVTYYTTYAPRGQRTRTDNEVPYEPWMVARKLRALSCFESQIEQESTRPWFTYLLDVREWYA